MLVGLIRPISCLNAQESGLKGNGGTQFLSQSQAKIYLVAGSFWARFREFSFPCMNRYPYVCFTILNIHLKAFRCYNDCSCAHHSDRVTNPKGGGAREFRQDTRGLQVWGVGLKYAGKRRKFPVLLAELGLFLRDRNS